MARTQVAADNDQINVKIAPMMGEVRQFVLPVDSTVEDALAAGGYNANSEVRITTAGGEQQTIASNDAILDDGDLITVIASGKVEAGR